MTCRQRKKLLDFYRKGMFNEAIIMLHYFRKNHLFTVTIGIILLAFIIYGFAGNIPMLIAARLIRGVGMGFLGPLTLALASNTLPESRSEASGLRTWRFYCDFKV